MIKSFPKHISLKHCLLFLLTLFLFITYIVSRTHYNMPASLGLLFIIVSVSECIYALINNHSSITKFISSNLTYSLSFLIITLIFLLKLIQIGIHNRTQNDFYKSVIFLVLAFLLFTFTTTFYLTFINNIQLHVIYLIIGLSLGIVFMTIIPAYQVPDEPNHLFTAYELSNKILGQDQKTLHIREEEFNYAGSMKEVTPERRSKVWSSLFKTTNKTKMKPFSSPIVATPSFQYILPAIGISIARLLHLSASTAYFFGRLLNLIFFVLAISFSIKITPIGKHVFFAIALFPVTIQQGMSFSYDVPIIAFSFLLIAEGLNLIYNKFDIVSKNGIIHLFIFAVSILVVFIVKQHAYSALLLLLLPVISRHRNINKKGITKVILLLFIIGIMAFLALLIYAQFNPLKEPAHYIFGSQQIYSLQHIINHPVNTFAILLNLVEDQSAFFISSMITGPLGWLEVPVNGLVFLGFILSLPIIINLTSDAEKEKIDNFDKFIYTLIALLTIMFICGGMLISWTTISSATIEGIQGRYFIPVMPIILILFTSKKISIDASIGKIIPCLYIALNTLAITSFLY